MHVRGIARQRMEGRYLYASPEGSVPSRQVAGGGSSEAKAAVPVFSSLPGHKRRLR
jgi:hypothetical protein